MFASLFLLLSLPSPVYPHLILPLSRVNAPSFAQVCANIDFTISPQSAVYYHHDTEYAKNNHHWSSSSSQSSACTVEPGTVEDVGNILKILGRAQIPFGIKSGGHSTNPDFSSSSGVLIAMHRFDDVTYDPAFQTAVIGTGLVFDDVYATLAPHNVSVLGGRVTGIGVGGFVLGGGYSWKTNQYGLALDTVTAFELVKPDGDVVRVTQSSDAELFFGLKGGFNNFGIVTRITMKTFPQTAVWGGTLNYLSLWRSDVTAAVVKFSTTNTDPKANIIASYNCIDAIAIIDVLLFYDAPNPPPGLFDDFLDIPFEIGHVGEKSLYEFIRSIPSDATAVVDLRGVFHTVPILEYSEAIVKVIEHEHKSRCVEHAFNLISFESFSVEPFLPTILSHNETPSAYPPARAKAYLPLDIFFAWPSRDSDRKSFHDIKQSAARIRDAAIKEGQDIVNAPLYPNYALFDTPLHQMYGDNVERLRALRHRVDPSKVMNLAGGFRF